MLVAVIDLGTNTFNLLIAELLAAGKYRILYNTKLPVKLGKGGINKNQLLPDAMERGINALNDYKNIIAQYNVAKTYAFATSAMREATNSNEFIKRIHELGISVDVISGDREAELIYKGVQLAIDIGEQPVVVMDIGGGSTEFIIANNKQILWKKSFLLGVSRLLEMFNPSDPMTTDEIQTIESYIRKELRPLIDISKTIPVAELVGSSGSFDSFADIIMCKSHPLETLKDKTEYVFNMSEVDIIFEELILSNQAQRIAMSGLVRMRVDMIVMAAFLARFVLKELKLTAMRLSTFSLKEGVMHELMEK